MKSLVFVVDGEAGRRPRVGGADRLDEAGWPRRCGGGDRRRRRATADEVRAATGFAVGGVPPLRARARRCAASSTTPSSTTTSCGRRRARRCTCSRRAGGARRRHRRARGGRARRDQVPRLEAEARARASRHVAAATGTRRALDLFSGTSRVGQAWKSLGVDVTAVDTTRAAGGPRPVLRRHRRIDRRSASPSTRRSSSSTPSTAGPAYVTDVFCSQARYFQPANGARIDAIRTAIAARWAGSAFEPVLLTALLEAADRVDSTTGVQMAYLKSWAPRSYNRLTLRTPDAAAGIRRRRAGRRRRRRDVRPPRVVGRQFDLAYLDPPYNQHSYPGELPRVGDDRRRRRTRALRRRLQADRHPGGRARQRLQPAGDDRAGARRAARRRRRPGRGPAYNDEAWVDSTISST